MSVFCYLNGKIIPVAEASVGLYDIGLLRGFGIYEAMMTYGRKPFMLKDHLARFRNSAKSLSLKVPASNDEIASAIDELIERSIPKEKEAIIRFILTGGKAIDGIEYEYEHPTFYILVEIFERLPETYFTDGCSLIIFEEQRQFPESKTTSYIQAVLLQEERKRSGALEILYISKGKVLEAATGNFFIVSSGEGFSSGGKNPVIITPKKSVLAGVTRKVTIDLSRPHFKVEERDVTVSEMYSADEAFMTSSFKEIVPVVKVGDKVIADGKVGKVTKQVMKLFQEFTRNY